MSHSSNFLSPRFKVVQFLERSRDLWKQKHHDLKMQVKLASNQVRAVEKSREMWRERAKAAEAEVEKVKAQKNIAEYAAS